MILVALTLPITNGISAQDIKDMTVGFNLGAIADQFGWCTSMPNNILKSTNKFRICFHTIDVTNKGIKVANKFGLGDTIINSR